MSYILDAVTAVVIIAFAIAAYRRGFLNTIARLAGTVAVLVTSISFSGPIAGYIFENYISEHVTSVVSKHLGQISAADVTAFTDGMAELIEELPGVISTLLQNSLGVHVEQWYDEVMQSAAPTITQAVIDIIIAPLATGLLRVLLFFVLFTVGMLLVNTVAGLLSTVNHVPFIGSLNEVLGGMVGGIQGMLYMFVAAALIWLLLSAFGGSFGPLSYEAIEKTWLFKYFYDIGPWVKTTSGLL